MKQLFSKIKDDKSRFIFLLSNFILFVLWVSFAFRHIRAYIQNPQAYIIIFIISELIIALILLFRKDFTSISDKPFDWIVSIIGTFLPLLFIPGGKTYSYNLGIILMSSGVILQTISALSINQSLGIVPADRGIKTRGMYKIVRHPMYLSGILSYLGYLLISFSLVNLTLFIITFSAILMRIGIEEKFLLSNQEYLEYSKNIKYRLIPFIY